MVVYLLFRYNSIQLSHISAEKTLLQNKMNFNFHKFRHFTWIGQLDICILVALISKQRSCCWQLSSIFFQKDENENQMNEFITFPYYIFKAYIKLTHMFTFILCNEV